MGQGIYSHSYNEKPRPSTVLLLSLLLKEVTFPAGIMVILRTIRSRAQSNYSSFIYIGDALMSIRSNVENQLFSTRHKKL